MQWLDRGSHRAMLEADLLAFVRATIKSTWALELLLLLRKHAPAPLTADALVFELRGANSLIQACLRQLVNANLIVAEAGGYRYAPATKELDAFCARLATAYAERPVAVITAIVDAPNDRLRSFADAFRITKKEE